MIHGQDAITTRKTGTCPREGEDKQATQQVPLYVIAG